MASKKVVYTGGQIANETDSQYGFIRDEDRGLVYVPNPEQESTGTHAMASRSHIVTETKNPIWNQVSWNYTRDVTTSPLYEGFVTLYGMKDDGTEMALMEKYFSTTSQVDDYRWQFDLLASACTGAISSTTVNGAAAADTLDITLPMRYSKYESVTLAPRWFDEAWAYRKGMRFEQSGGRLYGNKCHTSDYTVVTVYITYNAHMNTDFSDIRFVASDGTTVCPHYFLNTSASTSALALVAIPWWFTDKTKMDLDNSGLTYSCNSPQTLYMYYGNSTATSTSDPNLGNATLLYDDFSADSTIDTSKWTITTTGAGSAATLASGGLRMSIPASVSGSVNVIGADMGKVFGGASSIEIIWKTVALNRLSSTVANQGAIFRFTNSGGSKYYELRNHYAASGTGGGSAYVYGGTGTDTVGMDYRYPHVSQDAAVTRYFKGVYSPGNVAQSGVTAGAQKVSWYISYDGHQWDWIGTNDISQSSPGSVSLRAGMNLIGPNTEAVERYMVVEKCIVYANNNGQHDFVMDNFQNGAALARWVYNSSTNSETGGQLRQYGTGDHRWTTSVYSAITLSTPNKQGGYSKNEQHIYQTCVNSMTTSSSEYHVSGIFIYGPASLTTPASDYGLQFGIQRMGSTTYGSKLYLHAVRQIPGSQTDILSYATTQVEVTLPCHLRMVIDPFAQRVCFDYSTDGIDWKRGATSAVAYNDAYLKGNNIGLYTRTSASGGPDVDTYFDYIKCYSGDDLSFRANDFGSEEALSSYPLSPTSPADNDLTVTFNTSSLQRGSAVCVQFKEHGGGYKNSKQITYRSKDLIEIGPDGMDKYIGLRLGFDFNFGPNDEYEVSEIQFVYEVI